MIKVEADGVTISLERVENGNVSLQIDVDEPIQLSPSTAIIIGMMLQRLGKAGAGASGEPKDE